VSPDRLTESKRHESWSDLIASAVMCVDENAQDSPSVPQRPTREVAEAGVAQVKARIMQSKRFGMRTPVFKRSVMPPEDD
jgi:hypothetical protein